MKIKPRILYKFLLAIIVGLALYKELFIGKTITWDALRYFTIQSNILVFVFLIFSMINNNENRFSHTFRGITLISITLTGLVYNFVLYNIFIDWGTVGYTFSRTVTHLVAPIGFILDWIIFDKHGRMNYRDALIWLIYPLVYGIISIYRSSKGMRAIYFFLDISGGFANIAFWLTIVTLIFIFTALFYAKIDKILYNTKK